MKKFVLLCAFLWAAVFISPLFVVERTDDIPTLPIPTAEAATADAGVKVTLLNNGKVEEHALDEYLEGVVAAEMPALFPEEALKAQAVAARTYTMKKIASAPPKEHNGAAVCSDPAHCKAYAPMTSRAASWGDSAEKYSEKIKKAVKDTDGEILLYNNEPISAVFHSTSSGKTENAEDVWGYKVPYLVSVESAGEETSPRYSEVKSFTPDEFQKKVTAKYNNASFHENPENWISNITRSAAGGIKTVTVAGVNMKGSDLRGLLGLNSTNFTYAYRDGKLNFETLGYGHGVGMSQYGARAMAEEGKNYEEILKKYYTGVNLGKISEKSSS